MSGPELPLSRRTALLTGTAGAVVVAGGCGSGHGDGAPARGASLSTDDDRLLRRRAVEREHRLRDAARATGRRHRGLAVDLRRLVSVHGDHLELLELPEDAQVDRSGSASASTAVPRDPREAVRGLARGERALAEGHARAALTADSGPFARVLAGMAAAADQQAHLLDVLALSDPGRRARR